MMMKHLFKERKTLKTGSKHFTHFEGRGNYGADYGYVSFPSAGAVMNLTAV